MAAEIETQDAAHVDVLVPNRREPSRHLVGMITGHFAEFERAMVRERTRAGLKLAREQGRKGGRRPKLMAHQKTEILAMLAAGRAGAEIARIFRVHRATISRVAAEARTVSLKTEMAPDPLAAQVASAPLSKADSLVISMGCN